MRHRRFMAIWCYVNCPHPLPPYHGLRFSRRPSWVNQSLHEALSTFIQRCGRWITLDTRCAPSMPCALPFHVISLSLSDHAPTLISKYIPTYLRWYCHRSAKNQHWSRENIHDVCCDIWNWIRRAGRHAGSTSCSCPPAPPSSSAVQVEARAPWRLRKKITSMIYSYIEYNNRTNSNIRQFHSVWFWKTLTL